MLLDHAQHVARGGIGIEAQQQVGRGEMEEAERVRLDELAAVQQLAQQDRGFRNLHRHDRVAGLHRRQQMAHRANAADARGDPRHLVERPAFAELLEAAHLRHVKLRAGDAALVVEIDGDLGVSLDAGHDVDGNLLHDRFSQRPFRRPLSRLSLDAHPNLILESRSGMRPSNSSVSTNTMVDAGGGQPGT